MLLQAMKIVISAIIFSSLGLLSSFADEGFGTFLANENSAAVIGGESSRRQDVEKRVFQSVLDYAYPSMAVRWTINPISVCWENPQDKEAMDLVKTAVRESWSASSNLDFINWG